MALAHGPAGGIETPTLLLLLAHTLASIGTSSMKSPINLVFRLDASGRALRCELLNSELYFSCVGRVFSDTQHSSF